MINLERSYYQAILPAKTIRDLGEYVSADSTDIEKPRSTPSSAIEPTPHDAHSFSKIIRHSYIHCLSPP